MSDTTKEARAECPACGLPVEGKEPGETCYCELERQQVTLVEVTEP